MIEKIDVEEFTQIACAIDSVMYIEQDLSEGFFNQYNTKTEDGRYAILYEFDRARAKENALAELLFIVKKELERLGLGRNSF